MRDYAQLLHTFAGPGPMMTYERTKLLIGRLTDILKYMSLSKSEVKPKGLLSANSILMNP